MPHEHKSLDCSACLRAQRKGREGRVEYAARRNAQIARIVETAKAMSSREQAADMGITEERVRYLRTMARRLGHDVPKEVGGCLLYTSDAADERSSVDLGGRRI